MLQQIGSMTAMPCIHVVPQAMHLSDMLSASVMPRAPMYFGMQTCRSVKVRNELLYFNSLQFVPITEGGGGGV